MPGFTDRLMEMINGRSVENPKTPLTADNLLASLGMNRSQAAGVSVNRLTAMGIPALFNGVRIFSGAVARLPLQVHRVTANGRIPQVNHPAYRLVHNASSEYTTAFTLRRRLIEDVLLEGNGYAYIYRDNGGRPMQLRRLDPEITYPVLQEELNDKGIPIRTSIEYVTHFSTNIQFQGAVRNNTPYKRAVIPARDILHIRGVGPSEFWGYPVLYMLAESVGMSVAHLQYSSSFFANNATPNIVLTLPFQLKDEQQIERFRASWNNAHRGAKNQHKIGILEGGADVKPLSIDPERSQLLQSMQHDVVQIANIVNLPADLLGAETNTSYNSLEQTNRNTLTYRFAEMLENIESECDLKLLSEMERQSMSYEFRHDKTAMERPDRKTEVETDVMMINNGVRSVDEIRAKDGMPPLDGEAGSAPRMPVNIGFAEKILEGEPDEPPSDDARQLEQLRRVVLGKHFARYTKVIESKTGKPEGLELWLAELPARYSKDIASEIGVRADLSGFFDWYATQVREILAEDEPGEHLDLLAERAVDEIIFALRGK